MRLPDPRPFARTAPLASMALLALSACGGAEEESTVAPEAAPSLRDYAEVVPFEAPPEGVVTQPANNNLDVTEHDGRVFLAFRTAPTHFASDQTVLYVVSSADQTTWELETRVTLGTDLREPRLLSHQGKLFFYFAVLGNNALEFEPQKMMVSSYEAPGEWSEPADLYEPSFIPWRAKVHGGEAYMTGYVGGENIYDNDGEPIRVHFLRIGQDGTTLEPVVPGQPVIHEGGASETDFVFMDDGGLVAVMRNEAGEDMHWGSKICRAEAADLGAWTCAHDKKKYDSPLVFRHGGEVYLIGRRNLTESGNYDLDQDELSAKDQTGAYLVDYSFNPKRCSLWRVDRDTLTVSFVLDLPSRGDTCFASIVPVGERDYMVYNYTSGLDDDPTWLVGQGRPTLIYRILLSFP